MQSQAPSTSSLRPKILLTTLTSFLAHLLHLQPQSQARQRTVVICTTSSQHAFLSELHDDISHTTSHYNIKEPKIANIARTQDVKLVFVPSLAHLRAYLASFQLDQNSTITKNDDEDDDDDDSSNNDSMMHKEEAGMLAIWGSLSQFHLPKHNQHTSDTEHQHPHEHGNQTEEEREVTRESSAQSLARTLALLVDAGTGCRIVLGEPCPPSCTSKNIHGDVNCEWTDQSIPLLSNDSAGHGHGFNERLSASRGVSVSIGKVLRARGFDVMRLHGDDV